MQYDVDIVSVPARPVVSLRRRGPLADIGSAMRRLRELVAEAGLETAGPMMARFYDDAAPGRRTPTSTSPSPSSRAPTAPSPTRSARRAASGSRSTTSSRPCTAARTTRWTTPGRPCARRAAAVGYTPAGPVTEVYEVTRADGVPPEQYVTRVQLPYAR